MEHVHGGTGPGAGPATDDPASRLRAAVRALQSPGAAKRAPAPVSSVFGRAAAAVPDDVHPPASREVLAARLRAVETSAMLPGTSMVLVVVPTSGVVPPELGASLAQLARVGATVVVLGPRLPRAVNDRKAPLTVPLRADDSLASEWALVACGPVRRVAFLARREPEGDAWRWLVTRDSVAVQRAGTAILERVPFLRLRVPALATT